MHEWYLLVRASRYFGVTPWELAQQSSYWMNLALTCESIDTSVQNEMMKRNDRSSN